MIALLDTNAYTALVSQAESLLGQLEQVEQILMSSIVVGELEYGFRNGNKYRQNKQALDTFLAESYVEFLPVTRDTTVYYGIIAAELRKKGRKIPTNDAWIGAHALEREAELWSSDKHMREITQITIRSWRL